MMPVWKGHNVVQTVTHQNRKKHENNIGIWIVSGRGLQTRLSSLGLSGRAVDELADKACQFTSDFVGALVRVCLRF